MTTKVGTHSHIHIHIHIHIYIRLGRTDIKDKEKE